MIPYTYRITNKITSRFYIGSRYRNVELNRLPESDLWVKYFTSSKYVKEDIELYGTDAFTYEIILKDVEYDVCYWTEQELIKTHISDPLCMNKQYVDRASGKKKFSADRTIMSTNTRSKISSALLNTTITDETREKQSKARTGKVLKLVKVVRKRTSFKTYEEISDIDVATARRKQASINASKYHAANPKFGNKNPNAKCFELTDPTGVIHIADGTIASFCKDNKLNRGLVIEVAMGRRDHYRGWKIRYLTKDLHEL